MDESLLSVADLTIGFATDDGYARVVEGVSLDVGRRESVGIVGESGSGKTVTCKAILGMVDPGGRVENGDVRWEGRSLLTGPGVRQTLRSVRGRRMVSIPQDPMTSLDPLFTVGYQIGEVCRLRRGMNRRAVRNRCIELLDLVGVPAPEQRLKQYPHEFSGGMQQRVLLAMALAAEPDLLVADEPTTALDVTVQAQILELLRQLQDELDLALLLVTHDLGVVADVCDRIVVMYSGRLVEVAAAEDLFGDPQHPYSQGLLRSTPRADAQRGSRLHAIPGLPPNPSSRPHGCSFRPRCPRAADACLEVPELMSTGRQHAACWRPGGAWS